MTQTTDLEQRLRGLASKRLYDVGYPDGYSDGLTEAADELARLRAENEALRETLDDAMTKLDAPDPDLKPLRDFAIGVLWAIKEAAHTRTALKGSRHE